MSGLFRGFGIKGLFEFDGEQEVPVVEPVEPKEPSAFECKDFNLIMVKIAGFPAWINADYEIRFKQLADYIRLGLLAQHIVRVDSFNCRKMRWSDSWSYHSFGQAIDINPDEFPAVNARIGDPARISIPAWYRQIIGYAKSIGFVWGGDWKTVYDPMHLQIGNTWHRNI